MSEPARKRWRVVWSKIARDLFLTVVGMFGLLTMLQHLFGVEGMYGITSNIAGSIMAIVYGFCADIGDGYVENIERTRHE